MIYRKFGSTGIEISALGFGCMRLPEYEKDGKWYINQEKTNEMLMLAYEKGINYFDTAPLYCHNNSEEAIGTALKPIRDKVYLSTKFSLIEAKKTDDFWESLNRSLKRLQTDHIDFFHFWALNRKAFDEKVIGLGFLQEAKKAKEQGKIHHISFSFHDDPSVIRHIIDTSIEQGIPMESMLIQYNLLDRSNEEMMTYAADKGLGVVAMGPVGGGRLAAPTKLYQKLTGKTSNATYELAFRFCLGNPDLNCALSGMENTEMVKQNTAIASSKEALSEKEWKQLGEAMEQLKKFSELYCTGCAYCQPCPAKIDIPRLFGIFTHKNVYGLDEYAKRQFAQYKEKNGALIDACKDCGFCERKCPQKLEIRANLRKVEAVLSAL